MEGRILHSWQFWLIIGAYVLSAGVLSFVKLKYKENAEFSWGWALIPLCNWAAFLFFFFFVFLDGIIEKIKES